MNFYFLFFEPNQTENRFKPINFDLVFFLSKPVQTQWSSLLLLQPWPQQHLTKQNSTLQIGQKTQDPNIVIKTTDMKNKRKEIDLLFQFHLWHKLNKRIKTQRNQIHKGGEENQRPWITDTSQGSSLWPPASALGRVDFSVLPISCRLQGGMNGKYKNG